LERECIVVFGAGGFSTHAADRRDTVDARGKAPLFTEGVVGCES
jgi:hypothetical protein